MKKIIAIFGSLLVFAGTKSKAQSPSQVPVKKETVKPASGTAPKTDAVDQFLKLGDLKGEKTASGTNGVNPGFSKGANPAFSKGANPAFSKGANPSFTKGANPAFSKGANPTFTKGATPSTNQSVAPRHNPPPPNLSVAPRHKG